MKSLFVKFAFLFAALAPFASVQGQSGNVYGQAQIRGSVQEGVVLQTRNVMTEPQTYNQQMIGTTVGGVVGGLIGHAINRNNNSYVGGLIGAAAGGIAGNVVASNIARTEAREILLRTTDGGIMAVVQPLPAPEVAAGDRIAVLNQGGQLRIIHLNGALPHPSNYR